MPCLCSTEKSPLGWTLPAFPWYIDQTIAGAVSTATHGSSLKYGSLSEQVNFALCEDTPAIDACGGFHCMVLHVSAQAIEIELALANGTLLTLSSNINAHLFAAARARASPLL